MQKGDESDMVGMAAEKPLSDLNHPVHSSGCLQDAGARDGGYDYIDDVRGRRAWLQAEAKHKQGKSYTGNGAERKASVTCSDI